MFNNFSFFNISEPFSSYQQREMTCFVLVSSNPLKETFSKDVLLVFDVVFAWRLPNKKSLKSKDLSKESPGCRELHDNLSRPAG